MADMNEGEEKDIAAKMEELEVKGEEPKKTAMGEMKKLVEALYDLRDTYFPANKEDKITTLQEQMKIGLDALDYVPLGELKTTAQRADYELLKGVMLDVLPSYDRKAEEHLVKSVKLNPSSIDAWLALGNCFTKKGELTSAKNCYNRGLEKGPNKCLLCDLSMVERMLAQEDGTQNWEQLLADSIKHAKEAVDLEVTDGYSWYNYGNAYLTSFFLTGSRDFEKLSMSSKAYLQAQKDKKMKINPDLYYNYGTVNKYLENYEGPLWI
ncbi:hypothetical protein Syun_022220 [Stephania yunnanensis]|uniref:Tetratricopeptide repeat protein 5 n=1 Tax=Stephania yunnanensis TaxID=152371 RepID=A0AAP0IH82_9MAGN